MGHVSDFNGMNTCDEVDLNQAPSDLISSDSLLDLPLNENFMPIYHSFPDDIYRQPHLYASNNLSSFMNNEDDRNGYFDEPLELDLLLDSSFNNYFDSTGEILENDSSTIQHQTNDTKIEATNHTENTAVIKDSPECTPIQVIPSNNLENISQDNHVNIVDNSSAILSNEDKTYSTATVSSGLESAEDTNEQIPKLIIKLKSESRNVDQDILYPVSSNTSNVKSCSINNESFNCESAQIKVKDKHKRKKHKKKSRHKKTHSLDGVKKKICATSQNFNNSETNCASESNINGNLFSNKNAGVNIHVNDSEMHILNSEHSSNSCENLYVDRNFDTYENNYALHNIQTEPSDDEINENGNEPAAKSDSFEIKKELLSDENTNDGLIEPLATADAVDFQFEFKNTDELSLSPSPSISIKEENDTTIDDFSCEIQPSVDENIPENSPELETANSESSTEFSDYKKCVKQELDSDIENKSTVLNNEPNKSSSASDLIEELNAHHQQVFEEIEVSTTELQSELNDVKNSDIRPKTSHQTHISANDHHISQNKIVSKHGENDMNSQNHISTSKISSSPNHHVSAFQLAPNHLSSTARLRTISSSSSSVNSKSSTSHRSYRKRRRSSSSSSSCSDQEKFYNRPVKFDPVTQTYCDEFGREIRPSELKYYLNSKSSLRDSHSNNGSSSSSRSKSPRYKSYHRKHHKSRSGSRSHRRRRHSSSRSRSRSHSRGRRHKDNFDRKYRSPSPKHRSKRHYLDVENKRAYEERRVMYVGDIPPNYTVEQLKERFSRFGPIESASIKSKFTADGSLYIFGFVTFKNRSDVCEAIERGNENPSWPRFDLNFGGRRRFCNGNYTDLDGKVAEAESGWYQRSYRQPPRQEEDDFAELLRQEQKRLGMSKK